MKKIHRYKRRSIRLKNYDYSQDGCYFVTICTRNRQCIFGDVVDGKMILNNFGQIAYQYWLEIPKHFPNVLLDEFIIMPNHIHGIIVIDNNVVIGDGVVVKAGVNVGANVVGAKNFSPLQQQQRQQQRQFRSPSKTIGSIIRGYKIGVTKWFRNNTDIYNIWQRNYYEHIIRNKKSLNNIRQYIRCNPLNWLYDDENPLKEFNLKK